MSASLNALYAHLIFHVRYDSSAVLEEHLPDLFSVTASLVNKDGGRCIEVGGMRDHLHILCVMPKTVAPSAFIKNLKLGTNTWLKQAHSIYRGFAWQTGYGMFSVSPPNVERVRNYIANQRLHHRDKDFSKEYLSMLRESGLTYDEAQVFSD